MSEREQMMKAVVRERETEAKVRSMDAHEIVDWVHELEDRAEAAEAERDAARGAIETALKAADNRREHETYRLNVVRAVLRPFLNALTVEKSDDDV